MEALIPVLVVLAMLGALGALLYGVFQMARGGDPRRSNKIMQYRVVFQGVALALFAIFMLLYHHR
ncbi:MAG: twin transmembrane helix small protein [Stellaceae bacterium]